MARFKKGPQKGPPQKGIDWDKVQELGKMPDTKLAKKLGVSHKTVSCARYARDIPSYTEMKRKEINNV